MKFKYRLYKYILEIDFPKNTLHGMVQGSLKGQGH